MLQSINKLKIYFYLLIFFFLSSIFNFNVILKFNDLNKIKKIDIKGLSNNEEAHLRDVLNDLIDNNIFFIRKNEILSSLSVFNFVDSFSIHKVLPSTLTIIAKKTKFLGITIIDGNKFYIGANEKLIPVSQVKEVQNLPFVFGKFQISEFLNLQQILIKQSIDAKKISKYFYHKSKRWDLEFNNGVVLMLPYKNISHSIKLYKILDESNKINKNDILDLRIPNNIVLTNEEK